jgi:hypothetical protein
MSVIEFPGCEPPDQEKPAPIEAAPKSDSDLHAQAFRDIEPEICDCVRMSYIAAHLVMNNDEAAPFAVGHLYEILRRFRQEYYAAYHGDLAAIGRHAVIGDE